MNFPGELWLETTRGAVQFGFALAILLVWAWSLRALQATFSPVGAGEEAQDYTASNENAHQMNVRRRGAARTALALLMLGFVVLWLAGATLEMMRRAANLSGPQLFVALGAFSLLLAGVFSLVREWFAPPVARKRRLRIAEAPLRSARVAWTLVALSVAGWWFGGFALAQNTLFRPFPLADSHWPALWLLSLGGVVLSAAGATTRPRPGQKPEIVRNPCPALLGLLAFAAAFVALREFVAPSVVLVTLVGFLVFAAGIWGAHFANRTSSAVLAIGGAATCALLAWLWRAEWPSAFETARLAWSAPLFWPLALGIVFVWLSARRQRIPFWNAPASRVLEIATALGALVALFFFGPIGAIFWAFWPLSSLFYDALALPPAPLPRPVSDDPFAPLDDEFLPDGAVAPVARS